MRFDTIIRRLIIFIQAFIKRLSLVMNTITEISTGLSSVGTFKLGITIAQTVTGHNVEQFWNYQYKNDYGCSYTQKERYWKFVAQAFLFL